MNQHGNRQKHLSPNPAQRFLLNRFHQKIVSLVKQTQATQYLDTGCGEGFVMQHLQQHIPAITTIGGDFSGDSLLWGRENIQHQVPLTNLDLHHLPFADHQFPLVICLEVLEHLPNSAIGLRELSRVSSDYILISVPHEPFFRGANFLRGKHINAWGNDPEHLHNYSGYKFRHMVQQVVDIVWHGYSFPWQIALTKKRAG